MAGSKRQRRKLADGEVAAGLALARQAGSPAREFADAMIALLDARIEEAQEIVCAAETELDLGRAAGALGALREHRQLVVEEIDGN